MTVGSYVRYPPPVTVPLTRSNLRSQRVLFFRPNSGCDRPCPMRIHLRVYTLRPRIRISRRTSFGSSRRRNSCSQTRTTDQPKARKARLTRRSLALFVAILSRQKAALVLGRVACRGQPCQKQPSTNTAALSLGKTKSGLTENGFSRRRSSVFRPLSARPRRQPVMRAGADCRSADGPPKEGESRG